LLQVRIRIINDACIKINLQNDFFIKAPDYNSYGDIHLQDSIITYDDIAILINKEHKEIQLKENNSNLTFFMNKTFLDNNKNWKSLEKYKYINVEAIVLKQPAALSNDFNECILSFDHFLNSKSIDQIIEASKCIGTLRINKPSLYIFPSWNGDSAFFAVNGYSLLINGGYDRTRPSFLKFVAMIQQIDSILITHCDSDSLGGLKTFFDKKLSNPEIKPTILTVLGNLIGSKQNIQIKKAANLIENEISNSKSSDVDFILDAMEKLKIKQVPLVKTGIHSSKISNYDHINLYYKLGHGSLDLYVLSPFSNSADYKEFVNQQQNRFTKNINQKSKLSFDQYLRNIPLSHVTSAVVLLIWSPSRTKSNDSNPLRLLFPGNAPQHVIFNAIERVKDFDVLLRPICKQKAEGKITNYASRKSVNPVSSNEVKSKSPQLAQDNPSDAIISSITSTSCEIIKKIVKKAAQKGNKSINLLNNNENSIVTSKEANKSQASNIQKTNKSVRLHPVYVEVSYIPAHGNEHYCDSDFFKIVRARHYILSAIEPSEHILNALMIGKEDWEDEFLQVTLIPTYESESFRHWLVKNKEKLANLNIDVKNTVTLTFDEDENPDLSCQVLKLEF
jgi:microtubule-associated protein 1